MQPAAEQLAGDFAQARVGEVIDDAVADRPQGFRRRAPAAHREKHFLRVNVHIKSRRMHVPCELMPELDSHIGLVGGLVRAESRVPVDAKEVVTQLILVIEFGAINLEQLR